METNVIFDKGSESIVSSDYNGLEVKDNYYKFFSSNSVYLRNKYNMALEDYFTSLKNLWFEESKYSSNIFFTTKHPAYLKILQLGPEVLPLLLKNMSEYRTHWFFALKEISGVNPIKPEHIGNVDEMANDWIIWGEKMNYI